MNTVVVALVILAGCFVGLEAITCHSCSYVSGIGGDTCNDPYSANDSTSCSSGQTCQKSTISLSGSITTVTRSCSSSCSAGCVSLFSIETCTYCCSTDDCNGASAVTLGLAILAASVLGAIVAYS